MACIYSLAQLNEWASHGYWISGRWLALSCQGPRGWRDNLQIQAEGGSFTASHGVIANAAGGFLSCVCLSGILREPKKYSARERQNLDICHIQRAPIPSKNSASPPSPPTPTVLEELAEHSAQNSEGTSQTAQHEDSQPIEVQKLSSQGGGEGVLWKREELLPAPSGVQHFT